MLRVQPVLCEITKTFGNLTLFGRNAQNQVCREYVKHGVLNIWNGFAGFV